MSNGKPLYTPPVGSAEPLLDIDEASSILRLKVSTIYSLTCKRLLPHFKKRGRLRFDRAELIEWLRSGRRDVIDSSSAERHLASKSGGQQ